MSEESVVRITDKIATTTGTLYKTGGFALAFGFAGIALMLSARLVGPE